MAGITQLVPNYILGLSDQPDELKLPGQVRECKNTLPEITDGLTKRPGGKLVAPVNPSSDGCYFHYFRDNDEQYVGQIARNGSIKIYRCSDGQEYAVGNPTGSAIVYKTGQQTSLTNYLTHTADEQLQYLTVNDYTFVTNRTKVVAMSSATEPTRPAEAFIELQQVAYSNQYGVEIFTPTNTSTTTVTSAARISHTVSGLDEEDGTCPDVGTKIFNLSSGSNKKNLYIRITTTGQSLPETVTSTSSDYDCRYTTVVDLLYGGEGWQANDTVNATLKGATYTIRIDAINSTTVRADQGLIRPKPTPFSGDTTITASTILGDLRTEILNNTSGFTGQIIGNGLYLTKSSAFSVTSAEKPLLNILTDQVNDVGKLPSQCKHGYVVKVANSSSEDDDYYVKFEGQNNTDGEGSWVECAKPGIETTFDAATMPIQIVRKANGDFEVGTVDWDIRQVGDDDSNKKPTFVGKTINNMLFYRNRLVFLSDENVILSRPGDFFNFWAKTAITFTASDVIDVAASSTFPAKLFDGIEVNSGLVLFSLNHQFMLTTDSDVLSPETAKVNHLSTYNFNTESNPVSLGTTIGFLDNAGVNSRFFEMTDVAREGEPVVLEPSRVIAGRLPKEIDLISNSKENNLVTFAQQGTSTLFGFRYFSSGVKRLQAAWFTWELSGDIQYQFSIDDTYFAILKNGNSYVLQRFDLMVDDTTATVTPNAYPVHLDNYKTIATSAMTYSSSSNKTTFAKPSGFNSSGQLKAFVNATGTNIGRSADATVNGNNVELTGDWTSHDLVLGYEFDMEVELPTIYYTRKEGEAIRSDIHASLTIHRVKLMFGDIGSYATTLKRTGKSDYTQQFELTPANQYGANTTALKDQTIQTIPVYERNQNLNIVIKSSHPTPATVRSMQWEGDYSNRFYKRV